MTSFSITQFISICLECQTYFTLDIILVPTTNAYASKWLAPSVKFMAHAHWKKTWESGTSMSPLEKTHRSKQNIFNSMSVWMVRIKCSIVLRDRVDQKNIGYMLCFHNNSFSIYLHRNQRSNSSRNNRTVASTDYR